MIGLKSPSLLSVLMCALSLLFLCSQPAEAQQSSAGSPTKSPSEELGAVDPYGRTSPRGTVDGYLKAIRENNFRKAARFLDLSSQPKRGRVAARHAQELKRLMDHGGYFFKTNEISTTPTGDLNDELNIDLEKVGVLGGGDAAQPLILQRVESENGQKLWVVSQATIDQLPRLLRNTHQSFLDRYLPESLKTAKLANVPLGHWLAVIVVAAFSIALGWVAAYAIFALISLWFPNGSRPHAKTAFGAIVVPLSLVFAMPLYRFVVIDLGVQVVARGVTDWIAVVISWLALAWLGLRLVDAVGEYAQRKTSETERLTSVAAITLARRIAKVAISGFALITVLDVLGFDVTTGLAALGIGGLAFALGAQRTVENLVGSVTVVTDKPVRVGDFCKFGNISGTVEDIGIRSTQIRTLNRTIVTVPNGAFASMQIENFAVRDKFLFDTVLSLRYETTLPQIECVLSDVKDLLERTPEVDPGLARVRLTKLASSSLDIEVCAHIRGADYDAYLATQETLLLGFMEIVARSGTDFAFPSQTLYLRRDAVGASDNTEVDRPFDVRKQLPVSASVT